MILECRIHGVGIMLRSCYAADISHIGHAGEALDLAPVLSGVFGNLNQSIICPNIDQTLFLRRFCKRGRVSERVSRSMLRDSIGTPDLAHHRELISIETAR